MNVEIRVPMLPESVQDATLVAWRKQPGEAVGRDENLADLETDKVVLEVPSPVAGVLQEIRAQAGTTVHNGELLAVIAAGEAVATAPAASASQTDRRSTVSTDRKRSCRSQARSRAGGAGAQTRTGRAARGR